MFVVVRDDRYHPLAIPRLAGLTACGILPVELGDGLLVLGDDDFLSARQAGDEFGEMGLSFFHRDGRRHGLLPMMISPFILREAGKNCQHRGAFPSPWVRVRSTWAGLVRLSVCRPWTSPAHPRVAAPWWRGSR